MIYLNYPLSYREYEKCYMLHKEQGMTYAEIGRFINRSRERVRQRTLRWEKIILKAESYYKEGKHVVIKLSNRRFYKNYLEKKDLSKAKWVLKGKTYYLNKQKRRW